MPLSRQDVIFGRAVLAWRLVTREQLQACAAEVERHAAQGQVVPLAKVLVTRGLMSVDHYRAIVARIRQMYLNRAATASDSGRVARQTDMVPQVTASGAYDPKPSGSAAGIAADSSAVQRAVSGWKKTASRVTASGSQIEVEPPSERLPAQPPAAAPPPGQPVVPRAVVAGLEREKKEKKKLTVADLKRRPDAQVRKKLGLPSNQAQFEIGPWRVRKYLASGNMGCVYRVLRKGGPKKAYFALKVMKDVDAPEKLRQRFVQEARTMAKLKHPHIVQIHDAGLAGGIPYFVMDYLKGINLQEAFERGVMGSRQILYIMSQLCAAVAYAHSQSVLHRDLKPENVILRKQDGEPILTDFGLAKDQASGLNLTVEGAMVGTPLYMAPELLVDRAKATAKSEVYSLGAMLYQGLTGKRPYEATQVWALMQMMDEGPPPPVDTLCKDPLPGLSDLCAKALARQPEDRFGAVAEMGQALRQAAGKVHR